MLFFARLSRGYLEWHLIPLGLAPGTTPYVDEVAMHPNPYLMTHPVHTLNKAKLEFEELKAKMNAFTIFDFFVAAYHVMDYVKTLHTVAKPAINAMYADPDFEMCNFICNKGKHLELKKEKPLDIAREGGGVLGLSQLGSFSLGSLPKWHFYCDGTEVKPVELAERIIAKWERFFKDNGIA